MRIDGDLSDDGGALAQMMTTHGGEDRIGSVGRNDGDELAFIGDVERIEPKDFTGSLDLFAERDESRGCRRSA